MAVLDDIDKLVEYVNLELQKNPKATVNKLCDKIGIKQSTFKSRVHRANYEFDFKNRRYKKKEFESKKIRMKPVVEEVVKPKDNNGINRSKEVESKPTIRLIQECNKNIDVNALEELISLIEPIKEVIDEHRRNKNVVEVKPIELKIKNIGEVKQKLFKVDTDVLKKWEIFVAEHKQFKVQNLVSMALEEFIEKYK